MNEIKDCNDCVKHVQGGPMPSECIQCLQITEGTFGDATSLPFFKGVPIVPTATKPRIKIIGFTGKAGSGKSTLASMLVETGYAEYALSSPIKNGLKATFGLTDDDFLNRDKKEKVIPWIGMSPRRLAQLYGTEFGRDLVAPDIWLRCAELFVKTSQVNVVISDIRFENEATWLREMGGTLIHIDRPGTPGVMGHVSEDGVREGPGDFCIHNKFASANALREYFAHWFCRVIK